MAFNNLKVDELRSVAEFFVVDVEEDANKKALLAALAAGDQPVTWDDYLNIYLPAQGETAKVEPKEEAKPVAKSDNKETKSDDKDKVFVKYERKNPTWEILGYRFTKEHPFAAVPEEVAAYLIRNVEGFRVALPSEVSEFYG